LLKALKEFDVHDEDRLGIIFLLEGVVVDVHILEDVEGSGSEGLIDVKMDLLQLSWLI
jgi:hypothetical protein